MNAEHPDMEALRAVLRRRDPANPDADPSLSSRFRVYLSTPERARLELPVSDPQLSRVSNTRELEVCLMAGAHRRLRHEPGASVGRALRQLVDRGALSESTAQGRLLALTRQGWPSAAVSLRSVLSNLESQRLGVDWFDLAWAARTWRSHPSERTVRRWARDFARRAPLQAGDDTSVPVNPSETPSGESRS